MTTQALPAPTATGLSYKQPALSYKELQSVLKVYKSNGRTNIKLNSKEYDLRLEWVRLTAEDERVSSSPSHVVPFQPRGDNHLLYCDLTCDIKDGLDSVSVYYGQTCDLTAPAGILTGPTSPVAIDTPAAKYEPVHNTDDETCVALQCAPQGWDAITPPTWVEQHVPRWLQTTAYTKKMPHHYLVEGMGVVFPHELTCQATALTCDVLTGQHTQLVEDYFLQCQCSHLTCDVCAGQFSVIPLTCKLEPKAVEAVSGLQLTLPAGITSRLGETERQALVNLTNGVNATRKAVTSAARHLKAFGEGFMSGLKTTTTNKPCGLKRHTSP